MEDRTERQPEGILPLTEIIKQVRASAKPLHVPLEQPHASGAAEQGILSPKASLMYGPHDQLDLFANIGTGFHSNDAREAIIGEVTREQVRIMRDLQLEEDEVAAVLDILRFDPAHLGTRGLARTVGGEVGFRLRALVPPRPPEAPGPHFRVPVVSHYPGDVRFHAPVVRLRGGLNLAAALWWIDVDDEFIYAADVGKTEQRGRTRRWGADLEGRAQLLPGLWADADLNLSRGRLRDAPSGSDEIPLAPRLTSAGGLTLRLSDRYEGSLRYRHVDDRPANEDGAITAEGHTLFELAVTHHRGDYQIDLAVQNVLDAEWRAAQFATQSLLDGEGLSPLDPPPGPEIHFSPGNPRTLRLGVAYLF